MSEEEKEAIKEAKEIITGDYEYPSILNEIKKTDYGNKDLIELWNATDDKSSNYEEYSDFDIAKAIVYLVDLVDKYQKEIERKDKVFDDCKYTIIEYVKTAKDTMQKMEAMIEIEKDVINEFDKLLKGE